MQGSIALISAVPIASAIAVVFSAGAVMQRLKIMDTEVEKLRAYAHESRGLIAGLNLKVELLTQAVEFDEKIDEIYKHIKGD
ncbi:MAG: hypothetical protein ACHQ1H_07330 [Nitrososphaerales archaeon]